LAAVVLVGSVMAVTLVTSAGASSAKDIVANSTPTMKILSTAHDATIVLRHPPATTSIVHLNLPTGRWVLTGKLWGDSVPSTSNPNTVVRCSLDLWNGVSQQILDVSVFNAMRPTPNGTSAGVMYLTAVVSVAPIPSVHTVTMHCDDIYSNAQVHNAKLVAIGLA
jgi:hypothetical protein